MLANLLIGDVVLQKIKIDKLVIVEGKYDKIRLSNIINAEIIAVNGFSVFNDNIVITTDNFLQNKTLQIYLL